MSTLREQIAQTVSLADDDYWAELGDRFKAHYYATADAILALPEIRAALERQGESILPPQQEPDAIDRAAMAGAVRAQMRPASDRAEAFRRGMTEVDQAGDMLAKMQERIDYLNDGWRRESLRLMQVERWAARWKGIAKRWFGLAAEAEGELHVARSWSARWKECLRESRWRIQRLEEDMVAIRALHRMEMDDRELARAQRIAADLQAELDDLRDAVINDPEAARRALLERIARGPA